MTRVPPFRGLSADFGRHAPSASSAAASRAQRGRAAFFEDSLPRTVSLICNTPAFGLGGTSRLSFKIWASITHSVPKGEGWTEGSRRSEEHTSELQSRQYLVCRLLLEKK